MLSGIDRGNMYEKICYKKPFIKEAIMRFDFASPIPNHEIGLPPKLSDAALKLFPIFEPQKAQSHHVQIGGPEPKATITETTNFVFHGLAKEKTLTISANALVIQVRQYKSFEQSMIEALRPLSVLCELFPEIKANRIGIRYVNILTFAGKDPLDWAKYVHPHLLGITDFYKKDNLSRAFQILEYNFDEDTLKFQVGIANPDYPAKIKQRQFILDIDATSVGAFDYPEMIAKVKLGHGRIQELFESSITDATRTAMKGVKHAAGK